MARTGPRAEAALEFPPTQPEQIGVSQETEVGLSNETIRFRIQLPREATAKIDHLLQEKEFRHAIVLNLEIEHAQEPTGVYYEIYANLPANEAPTYDSIFHVGNLGVFLPKNFEATKSFDATRTIRALKDKNAWDGSQLTITLVPRGLLSA